MREEYKSFITNRAQEEAIRSTNGPLLLVSCPGAGKTTTLIRRIHYLLQMGVEPGSILMVTFTNAAARDMQEKFKTMYGYNPGVVFQTIHSLCFNLLRSEGRFDTGDILKSSDQRNFFLDRMRRYSWISDPWELSKDVITEISALRNSGIALKDYVPTSCSKAAFSDLYYAYAEYKSQRHKIDFDDMLSECRDLLTHSPQILKKWQGTFRYIQCDEYQDTNMLQRDILYLLAGKNGNLCVVGDDDQSIYGFRGADPSIMMNFPKDMDRARTIVMGTNYRSALTIVQTAEKLIRFNQERFDKDFVSERGKRQIFGTVIYQRYHTRRDEIAGIIRLMKEKHEEGIAYSDIAILFRTNQQAQLPVVELANADLPFYTTETVQSIYDGWIFGDIRSYARLALGEGGRDDILRVLNHPGRYLREAEFRNADFSYRGFRRAISYLKQDEYWKYEAADDKIRDWIDALGPGSLKISDPTEKLFEGLLGRRSVHYDQYLADYAKFRNTDPQEFAEILDQLREEAKRFEDIGAWFSYADDYQRKLAEDRRKNDRSGVTLTTMHKAKGLEWNTVFIIDVNKDLVPYEQKGQTADIEEERRLFYVAMTRAKDHLYILNSSRQESLFFKEIQPDQGQEKGERAPDQFIGRKVRHRRFGTGRVAEATPGRIAVDFSIGRKRFLYPDAFRQGCLTFTDPET